jgi:hypothetical protein
MVLGEPMKKRGLTQRREVAKDKRGKNKRVSVEMPEGLW